MGRIQIYISDEMETYLHDTFGNNKSRIIDALIFDLANGKSLSPEAVARAMDRKTYRTSIPNSSSPSQKANAFPKTKKQQKGISKAEATIVPTPIIPTEVPVPTASAPEDISPEISASEPKRTTPNAALLAKGLAGFNIT